MVAVLLAPNSVDIVDSIPAHGSPAETEALHMPELLLSTQMLVILILLAFIAGLVTGIVLSRPIMR